MSATVSPAVLPAVLPALLPAVLVLATAVGAVLRALVLARVADAASSRVRTLGSAWVNVPASALAGFTLVLQVGLDLDPAGAPTVAAVAVLGLCGGLSTWSTLALELSRSLLRRRTGDLGLQLGAVGVGVLGGLFGVGLAAGVLLLL